MMFEQFGSQLEKLKKNNNDLEENTKFIPVSSLEEVAIHLRDNDEDFDYEHYLVQIKNPKNIRRAAPVQSQRAAQPKVTPPPFIPKKVEPKIEVSPAKEEMDEDESLLSISLGQKPAIEAAENASEQLSAPSKNSTSATTAKMEKDDIPYLAENADLLLGAGEMELARNIYRAILKTGEASDIAYAGLARCADQEGLVDQAIQFAWDSVAFAPNKAGYQLLSQLLVQQGRDQEASQALNRAIKSLSLSTQEKAEYLKMIGNCHSRLGQTVDAERAYRKALELSPASDEVQSNLGSLYLEQGQTNEAKRCYQDAIASNGGNDKAWVGLGLCFVSEGDKEAAHDAFARSLEKNLRNSTAIFHLVKCAYEIKKYSTAERVLSNYVEIAPVSPSLLYSLAGLQFHVGKKQEASLTAKRILQIKGDHQGARDLIGRIEAE